MVIVTLGGAWGVAAALRADATEAAAATVAALSSLGSDKYLAAS